MQAKLVSFSIGTITGPLVMTGVGFQPKAIFFYSAGRTEAAAAGGGADLHRVMGFAVATTTGAGLQNRSMNIFADDGSTAFNQMNYQSVSYCIAKPTTSSTDQDGLARVTSMDADGFTLSRDQAFGLDMRIFALCLGGNDLTDLAVGEFSSPTTGTTPFDQSFATGLPEITDNHGVLFMLGGTGSADDHTNTDGDMSLGWATDPIGQALWVAGGDDGHVGTTQVSQHLDGSQVLADFVALSALRARAKFKGWTATGFDLTWNEIGPSAIRHYWIAIRGGRWLGTILGVPLASETVSVTGLAVQPAGGLLMSRHATTFDADDAVAAHDLARFGAWTGPTEQAGVAVSQLSGVSPADINTRHDPTKALIGCGGTGTEAGAMTVTSTDADGFTFTADVSGTITGDAVAVLMFGPREVTGGGGGGADGGIIRRVRRRRQ